MCRKQSKGLPVCQDLTQYGSKLALVGNMAQFKMAFKNLSRHIT